MSTQTQHLFPNIVLILADDMGIGDAGCYNAEIKNSYTPH